MCLLVLAWQAHPRYRLVLAANRDEFHERPAAPLAPWGDAAGLLAGRDLSAGGTWLGFDRRRRFGVVTNFRDLQARRPGAPSRGGLIPDFLSGERTAAQYLAQLEAGAAGYAGFNLLLGDEQQLWYASNRAPRFARALPPGVYGLSNYLLDTPWPKLTRVRRRFEAWIAGARQASEAPPDPGGGQARGAQAAEQAQTVEQPRGAQQPWGSEPAQGAERPRGSEPAQDREPLQGACEEALLQMLADRERSTEPEATGPGQPPLPPQWREILSAPFVLNPEFGTRCSTLALLEPDGALMLRERRFDAAGASSGESRWQLRAGEWPHTPHAPRA